MVVRREEEALVSGVARVLVLVLSYLCGLMFLCYLKLVRFEWIFYSFILLAALEGFTVVGSVKKLHFWKMFREKSSGQYSWAVRSTFGDWYRAHIIVLCPCDVKQLLC